MMRFVHNFAPKKGGTKHAVLRTDMETGIETMFAGNVTLAARALGVEETTLRGWIGRRVVINNYRYKFDK